MQKKHSNKDAAYYRKKLWKIYFYTLGIVMIFFLFASWGLLGKMPSFEDLENPDSNLATEIIANDGVTIIGVVLFLLVAGMEVDLSSIFRQGRVAMVVSVSGIAIPFVLGLGAGLLVPDLLNGLAGQALVIRAVLAGNVTEHDVHVGRLLGLEDPAQRVDPRIRDLDRPEPQLATIPHGHGETRHRVEDRRLARSREPHQPDSHAR